MSRNRELADNRCHARLPQLRRADAESSATGPAHLRSLWAASRTRRRLTSRSRCSARPRTRARPARSRCYRGPPARPPVLSCARCGGADRHEPLHEDHRRGPGHDVGAFRTTMPRRQNLGERSLRCPTCGQPFVSHHYGWTGERRDRHPQPVSGELVGPGRAASHRRGASDRRLLLGP